MTLDLFGTAFDAPGDDHSPVSMTMTVHDERPASWLLAKGIDRRGARWVPKSEVRRGVGRDENVWTMPRWLARDRGWL
ncbi:MAG: hypothetical protein EON91_02625 [Brevundimonas sp.]|uniref:hypothetical protein n=1 Tax=Brevundimonas sp. TaxID=1871086 RepID=UPI0012280DC0|nr:hypothetical protein [Brevundimonas sp.]RZJ19108.1 MAG: hypothetical protein EON91_02625 [Brevundimonas sp.]